MKYIKTYIKTFYRVPVHFFIFLNTSVIKYHDTILRKLYKKKEKNCVTVGSLQREWLRA